MDGNELIYLQQVLLSGTLTVTHGRFGKAFELEVARCLNLGRVVGCNSGSAAVHTALAALDIEPGSEVIVTPLTDFGGVAPVLWHGAIPVFCDVDSASGQMTAECVADRISGRTSAIIVSHLFGAAADVVAIRRLARQRSIPLIEDCAQAFTTTIDGQFVGTFGDCSCFSMQQTKHVCAGEGGFVGLPAGELGKRAHAFINKARDYDDIVPDHHFLAMNYRLTELAAAVALAQIERLGEFVRQRRSSAQKLDAALLGNVPFSRPPDLKGSEHSFWRFPLILKPDADASLVDSVARVLAREGIACAAHFKPPAFEWSMFRSRRTFGTSGYPFTLASPEAIDYSAERYPGLREFLSRVLVLPWNERIADSDVDRIVDALIGASA